MSVRVNPPSVDEIINYEEGNMDEAQTLDFFQRLVNSGLAWQLQGSYGRTAMTLLKTGQIHAPAYFGKDNHDQNQTS